MHTGNNFHLTFFAAEEIKSLLEATGFSVKTEVVERDVWMSKSALKKEIEDLIKNIRQSTVSKNVRVRLIRESKEFYKKAEKEGIKIPSALLINATLRKDTAKIPRI